MRRAGSIHLFPARFIIKRLPTEGELNYYVIDRVIVYALILTTIAITLTLLITHGTKDELYVSCNSPTPCFNPLYEQDCDHLSNGLGQMIGLIKPAKADPILCQTKTLYPGFIYGTPPDPFVQNAPAFIIFLAIIAIIFNHFCWNVGGEQTMKVKILVTPKNQKGLDAINQHFSEMDFKLKMARKAMKVKQEQLTDGSLLIVIPTTVTLTKATWEGLAESTMKGNGAAPEDYTVTVNTE